MTQISLSDVNDELAKAYCNASKKEQQKIKQIVEDAPVPRLGNFLSGWGWFNLFLESY
jgi:hypothetical protein